jgi:hypothetical protein
MISPIPSLLSLSCPQIYHQARTQSYFIPWYISIPWSRVKPRVLHSPSTAYTEYCIHCVLPHSMIDCLPLPASLSYFSRPYCTKFFTFAHWWVHQWIVSQLVSRFPPELAPPDWPPSSTHPVSLNHILQVYLQACSITVSKYISKLARSWLTSASQNSVDYSPQVYD